MGNASTDSDDVPPRRRRRIRGAALGMLAPGAAAILRKQDAWADDDESDAVPPPTWEPRREALLPPVPSVERGRVDLDDYEVPDWVTELAIRAWPAAAEAASTGTADPAELEPRLMEELVEPEPWAAVAVATDALSEPEDAAEAEPEPEPEPEALAEPEPEPEPAPEPEAVAVAAVAEAEPEPTAPAVPPLPPVLAALLAGAAPTAVAGLEVPDVVDLPAPDEPPLSRRERRRAEKAEKAEKAALADVVEPVVPPVPAALLPARVLLPYDEPAVEPDAVDPAVEPEPDEQPDSAEQPEPVRKRRKKQRAPAAAEPRPEPRPEPTAETAQTAETAETAETAGTDQSDVPPPEAPRGPETATTRLVRFAAIAAVVVLFAALPWIVPTVGGLFSGSDDSPSSANGTAAGAPSPGSFVGPVGVHRDSSFAGVRLAAAGQPIRIRVPRFSALAVVVPTTARAGVVTPPLSADRIGWWRDGKDAGAAAGSVVLAGHVSRAGGGALDDLARLRRGDAVRLLTKAGWITYDVRSTAAYTAADLRRRSAELLQLGGEGRLVLVLGDHWNGLVYRTNTVVVASPVADQPLHRP